MWKVWPSVEELELFTKMQLPQGLKRKVKERLSRYVEDSNALDLIDKLLSLDPKKRGSSDDALNHDFFWTEPMPSDLTQTLAQHTTSMFELLAPPRRAAGARPGQPMPSQAGARGAAAMPAVRSSYLDLDSSAFDRVF